MPYTSSISGALSYVWMVRDITEDVHVRRDLLRAQKMGAIGRLTGGLAHDFNNLLGVILGALDLKLMEEQGADVESERPDLINRAMKAAKRGAEITHRMLAFAGRQTLVPRILDVNQIMRSTHSLLVHGAPETITFKLELANTLWPCKIDPGQLENAVLNLVINARDAMPDGGVLTITTSNVIYGEQDIADLKGFKPGEYVMIDVTDTGTGMDARTKEQVFEPFFTTKEPGRGTGLGLSMIYGFVKQSDGYSNVVSEPGKGTSIQLLFPRSAETSIDVPEEIHTKPINRDGGEKFLSWKMMTRSVSFYRC